MISAITEIKGKQLYVREGDKILINYCKKIRNIENVLVLVDKEKVIFGTPFISGCKIEIDILKQVIKSKKIIVFKKKRRKGYHKSIGHRQKYTQVLVKKIIKDVYGN
jgi:large subunit ribosomal protein L21